MKYMDAPDLKLRMKEIVKTLRMDHIDIDRMECLRSRGSSTKRTIARVHTLGKLMQKAMKTEAFYAIEFLERFEKLSEEEQDKVIIHELMHVPKTFGGGFRQHDFVCEDNVELMYEKFANLREKQAEISGFEGVSGGNSGLNGGYGDRGANTEGIRQVDEIVRARDNRIKGIERDRKGGFLSRFGL